MLFSIKSLILVKYFYMYLPFFENQNVLRRNEYPTLSSCVKHNQFSSSV